jgi:hypothetical protein
MNAKDLPGSLPDLALNRCLSNSKVAVVQCSAKVLA